MTVETEDPEQEHNNSIAGNPKVEIEKPEYKQKNSTKIIGRGRGRVRVRSHGRGKGIQSIVGNSYGINQKSKGLCAAQERAFSPTIRRDLHIKCKQPSIKL